jgi:anaerobic magnesium-protoporphyrin IX monomethyl ester cyclase
MSYKVLLFNPRSANTKPRIPNSILAAAASIEGKYEYAIVDGNLEDNPLEKIFSYLSKGDVKYFGATVMPGPQLKQSIPITKAIREKFPEVKIIWGGYFPSNHAKTVLNSGQIDVVIRGPGDKAFPAILDAMESNLPFDNINNIVFKKGEQIIQTPKDDLYDQDALPTLP